MHFHYFEHHVQVVAFIFVANLNHFRLSLPPEEEARKQREQEDREIAEARRILDAAPLQVPNVHCLHPHPIGDPP